MAVSDRVTVLRDGRSVATVDDRELDAAVARRADGRARAAHVPRRTTTRAQLGERAARGGRAQRPRATAAPRPSTTSRSTVHAGEILGVAGVAGNGQRELAEAVTGLRPLTAGTIRVGGAAAARRRPARGDQGRHRARPGGPAAHGRRPEPQHLVERRAQVVPRPTRTRSGPFLRFHHIRDWAVELIRRYDVKAPGPGDAGAPALGRQPAEGRARARVLGRPARARDRRADARARRRRDRDRARVPARGGRRRRRRSCSSREDLDELMTLSDRIAVMYEGRIIGEVDAAHGDRRGDRPDDGRRRGKR